MSPSSSRRISEQGRSRNSARGMSSRDSRQEGMGFIMKTLMSLFWCVIGVLFILSPFILIWRLCVMRALRKVTEETPFRVRPLRTSTFQGCGHSYRGWKHFDDGTAEATIWFVLFHLPVFPCEKHRLIVHSDPLDPATAKIGGVPLIHPTITFLDQFEPLTELPVTLAEVLKTYGFAYIFMPLWLFGPLPLLWLHFQSFC